MTKTAIVWDNREDRVQKIIQPALKEAGYGVRIVGRDETAHFIFSRLSEAEQKNAFIVTSPRLEMKKSGLETLQWAKESGIPAIIYSSQHAATPGQQEITAANPDAGFYFYILGKPFDREAFIETINSTLAKGAEEQINATCHRKAIAPDNIRNSRSTVIKI